MKGFGIKQHLRMATLVPVILVSLLFAIFYNAQLHQTLGEHSTHLGEAYVNQLVPAAQLTILEGDTRSLQALVDAAVTNTDVLALAFYDATGQLLAYRGGKHPKHHKLPPASFRTHGFIENQSVDPNSMRFFAPITLPQFNLYSESHISYVAPSPTDQADRILGWLSIDLNTQPMLIKKYGMYLASILITLLGIALGFIVSYILSKKIHRPITRLRHTMKQISNDAFETPIKTGSPAELGIIEQGCVDLQQQYLNTLNDFNQHVDTATNDLQQGLELLEEKNIQLLLDKRKAEEELKQKSVLITNLSHEIRTPMNGIIGFANVLLETSLTPVARDHVKTIKSSAKDLLSILNNILDYAKINAGKLKLDTIPLDIRNCIDDVLTLAAPSAHKKGLDLIPSTALDVPKTVVGDPIRFKQIIHNLVSNAIKFTEQGHILVRTHVHEVTEQNYTLCLSITDTGIGISPNEQKTLFHAFHQAGKNTARSSGGSGLGLVICKQLTEHMQGRITLESNTNQGTTFSVYLTFTKLPAYEVEKNQPKRFSHIKAICFDTNSLHLEALCHGLGHFGISCIQVNTFNALEIAFAQNTNAQLAFITFTPEYEKALTPFLHQQKIPTILLSKFLIEDYQALGAQRFLMKPPSIKKIQDSIESILLQNASPKANQLDLERLRTNLRDIRPNLLIAEDNAVNRMLLSAWLGTSAVLDMVDDGEQALAICHQKQFDAILIDLHMPKLNGLEATRLIREHTTLNRNTPVLLISADSHDLDRAYLDKQKIDRKLPKPIDENLLLHHLITVLQDAKVTPINWSQCVQKMSGNSNLAREFLDRLVHELPTHQKTFILAIETNDKTTLKETAHTLRGACGFSGLPKLERALAKLEYLAQHTQTDQELKEAFNDVLHHIDAVIEVHKTLDLIME
ncbi:MAG: response regulator [Gammaproteobacteria bacterium]|nr:response regulator [Gammaproteobacteria bacterium]